ncbi:hypothetical protein ACERC8_01565 [Streptococcus sp. E29BA]
MTAEEFKELKQNQKENAASLAYLQGYIKGLEERLRRLESASHS